MLYHNAEKPPKLSFRTIVWVDMFPIIILILRVLLLAVLYAFIGWTIYTLWSDLRFQSQVLSLKKNPEISLTTENDSGEALKFTQNEITLGRDETCEFVVNDPTISGRHARLTFRNMHWWVEDLGSTNGTYLNEEKIETPTILISGDEMRIGKNVVLVEIESVN